jgi:PhnB protein
MKQLDVYLHFTGQCRAAMEHYQKCLGGELTTSTYGESPIASQLPPALREQIIHSRLQTQDLAIVADDVTGRVNITRGNNISLYLHAPSAKEIEPFFASLSEGGHVSQPLSQAFFGVYGMFTDRFGITWVFQADKP